MKTAAAALVLVARVLIMGPEGTHTLSEHRARIPAGVTGLLRQTLHESDLPGAIALYVTPATAPSGSGTEGEPAPVTLTLHSELWKDPAGEQSGAPPDEVTVEEVELSGSGTALVQIAESTATGRRLLLSLSLGAEADRPPLEAIGLEEEPEPVWFRVEAFRSSDGAREPVGQRLLKTLAGRSVAFEISWKRPLFASGALYPRYVEEGLRLTILPRHPPSGGLMTVEARLDASVSPALSAGDPFPLGATSHRTVSLGIPFEISLEIPSPEVPDGVADPPKESIVVEITPFLPPGAGG